MPEALEPEIVLGLDLALELDRALRLVTRVWNPRLRTNHISQGLKEEDRRKMSSATDNVNLRAGGRINSIVFGRQEPREVSQVRIELADKINSRRRKVFRELRSA